MANLKLTTLRKIVFSLAGVALMLFAGISFYRIRHLKESVVLGPGVTQVKKLSEYFKGIK